MRFKCLMLCLEKLVSKLIANIVEFRRVENIRPSERMTTVRINTFYVQVEIGLIGLSKQIIVIFVIYLIYVILYRISLFFCYLLCFKNRALVIINILFFYRPVLPLRITTNIGIWNA